MAAFPAFERGPGLALEEALPGRKRGKLVLGVAADGEGERGGEGGGGGSGGAGGGGGGSETGSSSPLEGGETDLLFLSTRREAASILPQRTPKGVGGEDREGQLGPARREARAWPEERKGERLSVLRKEGLIVGKRAEERAERAGGLPRREPGEV